MNPDYVGEKDSKSALQTAEMRKDQANEGQRHFRTAVSRVNSGEGQCRDNTSSVISERRPASGEAEAVQPVQ